MPKGIVRQTYLRLPLVLCSKIKLDDLANRSKLCLLLYYYMRKNEAIKLLCLLYISISIMILCDYPFRIKSKQIPIIIICTLVWTICGNLVRHEKKIKNGKLLQILWNGKKIQVM